MVTALTTIFFSMKQTGNVKVSMYSNDGKLVKNIVNQSYPKGNNFIVCSVIGIASGNYYFKISQASGNKIIRFIKS